MNTPITSKTVGNKIARSISIAPIRLFSIMRRYPIIPMMVIGLLVITAIFGPWMEPHDPIRADVLKRHIPPSWMEGGDTKFILGTDALGRDVLSRIIGGASVTLLVVTASVTTGVVIGTGLGLVTGYFGGFVDDVVMRIVDAWGILPQLLIIIIIVLTFGQGLFVLICVLAMLSWTGAVRLVRAETLSLRSRDYVLLAQIAGASNTRIIFRHILPGVINMVIVTATLGTGTIILTEASLSFLGAGIPPPDPTWGKMVGDERMYVGQAWWTSFFPGIAIAMVVMSGNFLGDWMRDRFDPTLRQL
ncbi:MAG: ABC transporter permease [SAR202 cluster bacterium]|nr:ABC transporter permease [SAR202 cluster bacterium]|tara:strand:- start:88 stop:996 length:909 start_codon:yes stop_codon:yes gene_type:complete